MERHTYIRIYPFSYPLFPVSHQCFCCIIKGFFVNVYLFIHYRGIILISGVYVLSNVHIGSVSVLYKQCLVPELGCEAVRLRPQRHRVVTVGISIYSILDVIPSIILFLIVFIDIYT